MSEVVDTLLQDRASVDLIPLDRFAKSRNLYRLSKRSIDLVGALALATVAIPIVATAAILVRLDGGKAFYCQQRIGARGRTFTMWKLRSMHANATQLLEDYLRDNPDARREWDENQKLKHDPRITVVGRILRKFSIDELPQLLNVVMGQMSLVGPRPFMPEQRALYPGSAYFSLRPGLTGLWQVSERNDCSFAERAIYDNRYAATMSFTTDIRIMIRTVTVVLNGTGC